MPPELLNRLYLLKANLESLLATAAKRTPGDWHCPHARMEVFMQDNRPVAMIYGSRNEGHSNAAFIASCAGNAEAGWRSTLAAIDLLLEMERQGCSFRYFPTVETILDAWPLASLRQP